MYEYGSFRNEILRWFCHTKQEIIGQMGRGTDQETYMKVSQVGGMRRYEREGYEYKVYEEK